jgi:hypothetical protein
VGHEIKTFLGPEMATSEAITIWAQNSRENTFSGFWQKISEAMDKVTIF